MRRLSILIVGLGAACGIFESDERVVIGVVDESVGVPYQPLEAPDTVTAGVPFFVTVTTVGGGCVRRTAPTLVQAPSPLARVLVPRDVERLSNVCTADLRLLERDVQLRLDQEGEATVRVIARKDHSGSGTLVIEKTIVVQ